MLTTHHDTTASITHAPYHHQRVVAGRKRPCSGIVSFFQSFQVTKRQDSKKRLLRQAKGQARNDPGGSSRGPKARSNPTDVFSVVASEAKQSCSWTRVFETASETKRRPRRDRGKRGNEDLAALLPKDPPKFFSRDPHLAEDAPQASTGISRLPMGRMTTLPEGYLNSS